MDVFARAQCPNDLYAELSFLEAFGPGRMITVRIWRAHKDKDALGADEFDCFHCV